MALSNINQHKIVFFALLWYQFLCGEDVIDTLPKK